MRQQIKDEPAAVAAAESQPAHPAAAPPRRRDAAALWRALAGMAISLALACLIVMLEFTSHAGRRADRMTRHAEGLLSRVSRLEAEVAAGRARISTARREHAAAQTLRALLHAPDAGILRLSPPPPAAGVHRVAPAHRPEAVLALSPREHRAVLMVAGLKPPADGTLFVLWWRGSHGAPLRAAEFRPAADGSALVTAALPPALEVTAAMVTVERAVKGDAEISAQTAPSGPLQLRGTLAR